MATYALTNSCHKWYFLRVMATVISGRRAERAILERVLASDRSELVALYGRRRVGKTFLVRRFFADRNVEYFEMVGQLGGDAADQRRIFSEALAAAFFRGQRLAVPASWHDAFRELQTAIEHRTRRHKRVVLFLDELPWIDTHRSGFLRELEHFWNAWCSQRSDIVFIVCGSAASWMLRRIVHARGGLHNRLTQTIRLLPFTLAETKQYFADRRIHITSRTVVELYMVLGGIPHYLDRVARGRSVAQAVDEVVLSKDGALAQEFDRLFASLFESDGRYVAVVRALAAKRRGLTRHEILDACGLPSGGAASAILDNLAEGGFISMTAPIGKLSRDIVYRLTDEFSLFHLKWLERARPRSWQHVRDTPRWRAWAGLAFESVCLKHVAAIEHALGISGIQTEASAWLHRDAQIDLLIDRADGVMSVCELKFTDGPFTITKRYAEQLRGKLAAFRQQTATRKALHLTFITSYGVTRNRYADELVDRELTMDALLG